MNNIHNCWEAKNCGRQSQGPKVLELGECPAAAATCLNGVNGGKNGGRVCWAVTGTLCEGERQGVYAQKRKDCLRCDFFNLVISGGPKVYANKR